MENQTKNVCRNWPSNEPIYPVGFIISLHKNLHIYLNVTQITHSIKEHKIPSLFNSHSCTPTLA